MENVFLQNTLALELLRGENMGAGLRLIFQIYRGLGRNRDVGVVLWRSLSNCSPQIRRNSNVPLSREHRVTTVPPPQRGQMAFDIQVKKKGPATPLSCDHAVMPWTSTTQG